MRRAEILLEEGSNSQQSLVHRVFGFFGGGKKPAGGRSGNRRSPTEEPQWWPRDRFFRDPGLQFAHPIRKGIEIEGGDQPPLSMVCVQKSVIMQMVIHIGNEIGLLPPREARVPARNDPV